MSELVSLRKMVNSLLKKFTVKYERGGATTSSDYDNRLRNLLQNCIEHLPHHTTYFKSTYSRIGSSVFHYSDGKDALEYIIELIDHEMSFKTNIKKGIIFNTAYDKIQQASESYRLEDYSSTFNELNTALELILKDKFNIPPTMKNIKMSNVMEIIVKEKVQLYAYFDEAKKRVVNIDNQIKHNAYVPDQPETIRGIKIMNELYKKLDGVHIVITEDIQDKIYRNLYS